MINRRIDSPVMRLRMTPEMGEKRIFAVVPGSVVVLHKAGLRHLAIASGRDAASRLLKLHKSTARSKSGRPGATLCPLGCCACLAIPDAEAENPAVGFAEARESVLVRLGIPAIVLVAVAACSSSAPAPPSDPTASAAIVKKDCSDPKWREENLGLWYSVCRPPLRW